MKINRLLLSGSIFLFFALTPFLAFTTAFAATIRVPSEQPTIQAGIDAAVAGDTVLVADGTYTGSGNKNLDIKGKAITVQSENGPNSCIIECEGNGRGFYFHNAEGQNSVVSGFTITNGLAQGGGGGIYCARYSSPTITNCTISNNSGGGVFCGESSPTITNCTISSNSGGGIYCATYSSPTITNCTISNNSAYSGGGINCPQSTSPTITNCIITGNTATGTYGVGGGIYCHYSSPTITDCTISGNMAYKGGGIYCNRSFTLTITNCTISNNSSTYGIAGGIYLANEVGFRNLRTITNCIISGNTANGSTAGSGGGIYCSDFSPTITNCTISGNTTTYSGGGIYCTTHSSPTIVNSIFWGNAAGARGNEIYLSRTTSIGITYSDIQEGYDGEGNIDQDPLFVGGGDYHLTALSPCINTGNNDAPDLPETDKDGNPRIVNVTVDMGAYEYNPLAPIADAGPDQTADAGDTIILDGSNSYDPEGETLTYLWTQTGGTIVNLSDTAAVQPTFTTPEGETSLSFQLAVTNTSGLGADNK